MKTINIQAAKTHLSRLVDEVVAGEARRHSELANTPVTVSNFVDSRNGQHVRRHLLLAIAQPFCGLVSLAGGISNRSGDNATSTHTRLRNLSANMRRSRIETLVVDDLGRAGIIQLFPSNSTPNQGVEELIHDEQTSQAIGEDVGEARSRMANLPPRPCR